MRVKIGPAHADRSGRTRLIHRVAIQPAAGPVIIPGIDEKALKQRQAFLSIHAGNHRQLHISIQGRHFGSLAFGPPPHHVILGIEHPGDAAEHDGGKAHQARFK